MTTDAINYESIREHALDKLDAIQGDSVYGCDLHNELFNMDYFIIGRYQAKQWLGEDAFEAIEKIKQYEQDNFGEVTTDLTEPERVVNMYAYIIGEEILSESKTLFDAWNRLLTDEDLIKIRQEIKNTKTN